jgi:endonuclease/exonuclease/phosphatase family metal-dependent hydrolase
VADEEYGDAILSKYPLKVVKADALPEPQWKWVDEPRGALWVSLRVDGHEVQVINTHFGLGRIERRMQARELLSENWVGSAGEQGKPVIVCGDFNSPSSGMVHRLFRSRLRDCQLEAPGWQARRTFPTRFPVLCLDYIFVSEKIGVVRVDVPRTPLTRVASDHLPIIAELDLSLCKATLEGAAPELTSQRLLEQGESRVD